MEFSLLGPLLVRSDEELMSPGGAKQRALLALLLLAPNRVVARDRLIEGLWEEPPRTAAETVQVYVSRLRKLLPAGMLVTRSPGYVLELDPELVDAHRFTRLVGDARSLPPAQAALLLRQALGLWRGPALAEFADEPRLRAESARLEEARVTALEQRLEADLQLGLHGELVGELQALVSQHPFRERLIAQLMLALYRAGRQAEALATYRHARAALVNELGLEPGHMLQTLEHAILRHDPSLDPPGAHASAEARDGSSSDASLRTGTVPALKIVTVVFCDPVVSTEAGERLDPEALQLVTSRLFEAAKVVMRRHGGYAERLASDSVTSVFGLPLVHEDDAIRALRAAAELRTAAGELNRALQRDLASTLDVRIGISTGEVVIGPEAWPPAGPVVGAAARLQQTAAAGEILIAAETLALVRGSVQVDEVHPGVYRVTEFEPWGARMPRRLDVPMVGRDPELAQLDRVFTRAVARRECVICTLVGAAGVGKSRLTREFVAGIDARVVEGHCLPYGDGITYAPVVDVVGQLGDVHRELIVDAPAAATTIAALLGDSQATTVPEEIAWSMRKLFEAGARERPLVVVFDDVQWGETAFFDGVEQVARLSTGAPIMFLCLARPELLEQRPGWSLGGERMIMLEPLAPDEVDELIDHLLHGEELEHDLGARVRAAAQGNPLFVEEIVAMVQEAGGDTVLVPPTITALLAARLDQLEPTERMLLGYGSVEGELFHRGAVEALASSSHSFERALVGLVRKELVRPDRSPLLRDDAYRFRHLLIRDAAYAALPKATRRELHVRFAAWLADHDDQVSERDELLGHHLEQAHRFGTELGSPDEALGERAAAHLVAAARRAAALSDFEAVAGLLRRALSLGISDSSHRLRAQFELGHALHQTRRTAEAEAVLAETHTLAGQLGEDAVAALALVQSAWNHTGEASMDYGDALIVAQQAIDVLTRTADNRGLALARRLRAIAVASHEGPTPEVGAELERALAHARASGDNEMLRLTIGSLANRYLVPGPTPAVTAIGRCEQLLEAVHGDRVLEATIKRPLGLFYAMAARPDEANKALQEAAVVLDELDLRSAEVYRWVPAYARELVGDVEGAERELKRMFTYFHELRGAQIDTRASNATLELARIYCDEQRWDEAADALAYDPDAGEGSGAIGTTPRLAMRARLAAHEGLAEALPLAEQAVAWTQKRPADLTRRARAHLVLAEVHRSVGRDAEAQSSLAEAIALFDLKGNLAEAAAAARRFAGTDARRRPEEVASSARSEPVG